MGDEDIAFGLTRCVGIPDAESRRRISFHIHLPRIGRLTKPALRLVSNCQLNVLFSNSKVVRFSGPISLIVNVVLVGSKRRILLSQIFWIAAGQDGTQSENSRAC